MLIRDILQYYYIAKKSINASDTLKGELGHIRSLTRCFEHLGIETVEQLRYESLNDMVGYYRAHTQSKNASINKYVAYLKAAMRYGGYVQHPFLLTKKLKDDTSPVKPIHTDDLIDIFRYVKDLDRNANSHVYRGVEFLLYATGCRIGELLNIKIRNIDRKHRTILLEQTKSKKERYVFYTEMQDGIIDELISKNKYSPYLFWNHIQSRRLVRDDVRKFHRDLQKKLGLNTLNARQFRKTMATDLAKVSGDDLKMLQTILGHADIKMTQVYVEYSSDIAHAAYNKATNRLPVMGNDALTKKLN